MLFNPFIHSIVTESLFLAVSKQIVNSASKDLESRLSLSRRTPFTAFDNSWVDDIFYFSGEWNPY